MLLSLHVKNLALIEEEEILFSDGLNILTGETGAGKSIVIGSIGLALGARADRDVIRTGAEYALIELLFGTDNERQLQHLREMDIEPDEEGTILIKRRIYPSRSQCQVNGETVPLRQLRRLGELLIDIYGQRENQRLLRHEAQRQVLDEFAGAEAEELLDRIRLQHRDYVRTRRELEESSLDSSARAREIDLVSYEINEIESAQIEDGEEERLEAQYRRLSSFRRISEAAQGADQLIRGGEESASEQIGRANRILAQTQGLDEELDAIAAQLADADELLADAGRALADYLENLSFDPKELADIEERLDLIHHLEDKYGGSAAAIRAALEERRRRLSDLLDYDALRARLQKEEQALRAELEKDCAALSCLRQQAAGEFREQMTVQLGELNFPQVEFRAEVTRAGTEPTAEGWDDVSFLISMNPGEPVRPLESVASGGELSRIMLAMKTVFAGKDEIHTFIFDEIDTGISGQTAWKVSQKMGRLARDHQILCITHLPQIAAMEERHLLIEKSVKAGRTQTHIRPLSEEESTAEIARMMGGEEITQATLKSAGEMKAMARSVRRIPDV